MALKIIPGRIESDGHVVLLPAGLTGEVTVADGTTYDLGPASQVALEVESLDHGKEVALEASRMAHDSEALPDVHHDEAQSLANLDIKES